jgi:hypothetical protein
LRGVCVVQRSKEGIRHVEEDELLEEENTFPPSTNGVVATTNQRSEVVETNQISSQFIRQIGNHRDIVDGDPNGFVRNKSKRALNDQDVTRTENGWSDIHIR